MIVSSGQSHAPIQYRIKPYLETCLKRLNKGGRRTYFIDIQRLAKRICVSPRTIERGINWLKNNDECLCFDRLRVGRSFKTIVRFHTDIPSNKDFSSKNKNKITPQGELRDKSQGFCWTSPTTPDQQQKIRGLAFFLTRQLKKLHHDHCRVRFLPKLAFAYAQEQLAKGFDKESILNVYSEALDYFHGIASDVRLINFVPSGVIARARTYFERKAPDYGLNPVNKGKKLTKLKPQMKTGNEDADTAFERFYEASEDTKMELVNEFNCSQEKVELSIHAALNRNECFELWLFERYFSFSINIC